MRYIRNDILSNGWIDDADNIWGGDWTGVRGEILSGVKENVCYGIRAGINVSINGSIKDNLPENDWNKMEEYFLDDIVEIIYDKINGRAMNDIKHSVGRSIDSKIRRVVHNAAMRNSKSYIY